MSQRNPAARFVSAAKDYCDWFVRGAGIIARLNSAR